MSHSESGGCQLKPVCSVVASVRFLDPNPWRHSPRKLSLQKPACILFSDFPCPAHQGSLLLLTLNTNNMSHTALGCQKNDCKQIPGQQRERRKSIICQHSTCVFRVVTHCAQTDNCPSWGYKGGAELKARFGAENKGSLQQTTSLFKMLLDWSGMRYIDFYGQKGIIMSICKRKGYCHIIVRCDPSTRLLFSLSMRSSCSSSTSMTFTL